MGSNVYRFRVRAEGNPCEGPTVLRGEAYPGPVPVSLSYCRCLRLCWSEDQVTLGGQGSVPVAGSVVVKRSIGTDRSLRGVPTTLTVRPLSVTYPFLPFQPYGNLHPSIRPPGTSPDRESGQRTLDKRVRWYWFIVWDLLNPSSLPNGVSKPSTLRLWFHNRPTRERHPTLNLEHGPKRGRRPPCDR